MNLERRNKYMKKGNQQPIVIENQPIDIDTYMLDMVCRYVMSSSIVLRRKELINLNELVKHVDDKNDIERKNKISFIEKGLDARLNFGLVDPNLIFMHIQDGSMKGGTSYNNFHELSINEIQWISKMITEMLDFKVIFDYSDKMMDICTKVKTNEYGSKREAIQEFEKINSEIQNLFRQYRYENPEELTFSLKKDKLETSIRDIHRELTSPRNTLITGMQGMNELLGGGFESGRCYVYFGLPGEGKSVTLLNLAYQIKKYNKDYKTKDPTKTPCVLLLTMENKVKETVNRLFDTVTSAGDMKNYDPEEIMTLMEEKGELILNDDSPIDIVISFKSSNSVDTNYLYTLTEDLEDEGYEVICLVQDYIGRIRSSKYSPDLRLEYGNVVDEMKTYAGVKDIPVITAAQLNRDAGKHIDEARQKNKPGLVTNVGRGNIGESILILNNIDGGYIIAPEIYNMRKYLGIQKIKTRFHTSPRDCLYLPFKENSQIALEEDYGLPVPKFRTNMVGLPNEEAKFKVNPLHTNGIYNMDTGEQELPTGTVYISESTTAEKDEEESAAYNNRPTIPMVFSPMIFDAA